VAVAVHFAAAFDELVGPPLTDRGAAIKQSFGMTMRFIAAFF
jgi:hypothetical protein